MRGIVWRAPALQLRAQPPDQPCLCRRIRLGRTASKVSVENGRKTRKTRIAALSGAVDVLLQDQHEGYITWSEFERNQQVIADNATGKGSARPEAQCGRVDCFWRDPALRPLRPQAVCGLWRQDRRYWPPRRSREPRNATMHLVWRISRYDAVGYRGSPGLETARRRCRAQALQAQRSEASAARRQLELALQQAHFSRPPMHVANTMPSTQQNVLWPASWNAAGTRRCKACRRIEGEIAVLEAKKPARVSEQERQRLMQLGADLDQAWSHPAATTATRKRTLRAALNEIVCASDGGFIEMILHWQGGDHTALKLKMNGVGKHRWGRYPRIPCR